MEIFAKDLKSIHHYKVRIAPCAILVTLITETA